MYANETIEPQRVRSVVGSVNGRSMHRRTGGNNSAATSRLFMNAVKDASKSARNPVDRSEENVSYRSDRGHSKRPYSPTMDYHKEDQKIKSRKVENESEYDRSFESDHSQDRYSRIGLEHRPSDQGLYMPSPPDYERGRYVNEKRPSQQNVRLLQQPISVLDRLGKKGGLMTAYINPAFFQGSGASITNTMSYPSDSNNNIKLTPKASRCRHWPNCDLGPACKFHHPTEICPMAPNCPNSPKTCLYIHPASHDFVSYDQRGGLYRPNAFGNGTGQGAFGPRSSGLSSFGLGSMGHGVFGQGTSYQSQRSSITLGKSTAEQGLGVQSQQKEKKSVIATEEIANATNTSSVTATSNNTSAELSHERDASSQVQKNTSSAPNVPPAVLCKFSENCANPNCMYAHASPASAGTGSIPPILVEVPCKFGSECAQPKCRYSHPSPATIAVAQEPCRYYPSCQNPICPYLHVDYSNTMKVPTPCRNGAHCTRPGCHFMHPWDIETDTSSIPCKFGFNCRRPDCAYAHPVSKNSYSHISERTFAVPEEMTEKILPLLENQDKKENESVQLEVKNELNSIKPEDKEEERNKSGEAEEDFIEEDFNWDLDFDVDVILNDEGMNGDVVTDL